MDERAPQAIAALVRALRRISTRSKLLVAGGPGSADTGPLGQLRKLIAFEFPADVEEVAAELSAALGELDEVRGTEHDRLLRSSDLLEQAVSFSTDFETDDCPVCGNRGRFSLNEEWRSRAAELLVEQREAGEPRGACHQARRQAALQTVRDRVGDVPQAAFATLAR